MGKWLAAWWFKLMGLRLEAPYPLPAKCVVVVVPHTSNWDFPIGLCVRTLLSVSIHFVGKDSLFRWPFGGLFRWLGGVPVNRSERSNFVQAVAAIFAEREVFRLTLAPEGTRAKVDALRTGFYYIALEAKVPLVLCAFDWGHGVIRMSAPFYPSGDLDKDLEYIYTFFAGAVGLRPARSFTPAKKKQPGI
jgi:1-acyl-sn-glycerol-3-phosphate acyltransferase